MTLLFLYGTLRRGGSNHHRLEGQTFLGEARTRPGFRLFDLGCYPGLVPYPEDKDGVSGEVWRVDAACLEQLDRYEGVAEGLYRREPIPLLPPFAGQVVEAYLYAHSVLGRPDAGSVWRG